MCFILTSFSEFQLESQECNYIETNDVSLLRKIHPSEYKVYMKVSERQMTALKLNKYY